MKKISIVLFLMIPNVYGSSPAPTETKPKSTKSPAKKRRPTKAPSNSIELNPAAVKAFYDKLQFPAIPIQYIPTKK